MTKWVGIHGKFTKDEYRFISNFIKENDIKNENKLVRRAIEDLLGISLADAKRKENQGLPKEYLTMYYFYEYCKKAFKSSPEIQNKLEELFKKWASGYWGIQTRKHNEKLGEANLMWKHFKEHKKVGRSKRPKKPRGRPKLYD